MPRPIRFLFDYASPWAYLASERIPHELADLQIDYEPVYLRGFESFSKGMPYGPAKLTYITQDFARCAEHLRVATGPPASFPINGIHALRGALVAQELGCFDVYHAGVNRGVWRDSKEIGTADALLELIASLGLDAPAFQKRIAEQDIKQKLISATEAAVALGAFGVPTFIVGEEIFWGQDRMDYVRRAALA
jgi:2-hydroxychromene-2-carboxylate isomerase